MKKIIKASEHNEFYTNEKCFISELLNSGSFAAFSIAQARVEPKVTTSLHRLRDTDEVYYILSGKGKMEIDDEPAVKISCLFRGTAHSASQTWPKMI